MKKHILMATTALAIGFAAPVAAQDDFAGFSEGILAMIGSQGATVSFDERNVGADGSVELVGFSMAAPDGEMTVRADWLKGVPSATTPGQVTFTLSPNASVTLNDPDSGEHIINISNSGLVITLDGITSGQSAPVLNFSVMADSLGFTSGNPADPIIKALDIEFTDLSQTVSLTTATMLLTGITGLSAVDMNYDINTPDDGQMASDSQMVDLSIAFQIVADDDEQNFFDYLSGTTTAFIELSAGASSATAKINNSDARIAYTGTSAGTEIVLRAENGYLNITEEVSNSQFSFSEFNVDGMPLPPFDVSLDQLRINFSTPTVDHGSFETANAEIALRNLVVSDSIYSMFDPEQNITRSPVNVVANLSANVQPSIDWANPEQAMMSGDPADIGAVQDITINEVLITAGGAEITATGSATIDNSMGFPFPTGKVTITAAGVQALVNGLVAMGVIPQAEAGMAMGMMMAFARPGENADEFISDIEFSPEGITANGVPLPM
ncbi:MAG: DUF2125 domain-containing protein [Rhodobacteraceae bacterium]|nr:DUF2125 domain-containing protein [Paracoccaceae bacterium]